MVLEGAFLFCTDEFIMHRKIWMSQIFHAHNCSFVQKKKRTLTGLVMLQEC